MAETPWYLSRSFVLILLGFVGPLGLPALWLSPRFNLFWKIILTLAVIALTWSAFLLYPRIKQDIEVVRQAFPELAPYIPK